MDKRIDTYIDGVKHADRRMLAKTITLVESTHPDHHEMARRIVDRLLPLTGKAVRLGVTGVPGVGKSTFIEHLGVDLVKKGKKIAVLAVDPSSSRSGGSILADKTRMEQLSSLPNAFIRPSPSGGTLGGVARMTRETMLLCEAAGFDVVIVETVGVGQSETAVAQMVDFFLVLMLAGAGDELQGIKKGVLELADMVAVNKADGDNVDNARRARRQYENALHLLQPASTSWTPPVLTCSALTGHGLDDIWAGVCDHRQKMLDSGELMANRQAQALEWMWTLVDEGLKQRFYRCRDIRDRLPEISTRVRRGDMAPTVAAQKLLFLLDNA